MVSFNQRLIDRAKDINSFLCVGIDISPEKLGSDNIDDLIAHSKLVVDATRDMALAFKPNFAFLNVGVQRVFYGLRNWFIISARVQF